jgi:hypothetical protein
MAIVRGDEPQVFLADSVEVLGRVLAINLVARTSPREISSSAVGAIRDALLDERWADAVTEWMSATGHVVDAYPDEEVWSDARLDAEQASMEIRMARIFDDSPGGS